MHIHRILSLNHPLPIHGSVNILPCQYVISPVLHPLLDQFQHLWFLCANLTN